MADGGLFCWFTENVLGGEGHYRVAAYLKVPLDISGLNGLYILKAVMVLRP
jgi:hypothetical protein